MKPSLLPIFQAMFASLYEETLGVPERIVLPARTFDPLLAELHERGFKIEKRPGAFGYFEAGQQPAIEMQTDSGVVRIERGR